MKPKSTTTTDLDMLAINAARVLNTIGARNPDYSEWRYLRNSLLKIMPRLSESAARIVGESCSAFGEA